MKDKRQEAALLKLRVDEARSYHAGTKEFFSLLWSDGLEKHQRSQHVIELEQTLQAVGEDTDHWLSQAEFTRPNRRMVNLASVSLLFCDLDTYRDARLRRLEPVQLVVELRLLCSVMELPEPSLVIFSGRGLQAKWLLDEPVLPPKLPMWRSCQQEVAHRLQAMMADAGALDPSRVLRVVGTINTRSGLMVELVHGDPLRPVRYDFDALFEQLIPRSHPIHQAPRPKARAKRGAVSSRPHAVSWQQRLATARFYDLRTLIELRGGRVEEGARMTFLFWCLNFFCLAHLVDTEDRLLEEADELVKVIDPDWRFERAELSTLLEKTIAHAHGEVIMFEGRPYPPLYTPRNDHLIALFHITLDEQRQLSTIISDYVYRERDRERDERRRRDAGALTRSEYLESATDHNLREKVIKLQGDGLSTRAIGEALGISNVRVWKILKNI